MQATVTIGVPFDSVGRGGGTETAPSALRELGLPEALGARDEGDLPVRIRGDARDPATGLLASDDVLESTTAIRRAVAVAIEAGERPFLLGGCCAELPGALAGAPRRPRRPARPRPPRRPSRSLRRSDLDHRARPPTCRSRWCSASARTPGWRRREARRRCPSGLPWSASATAPNRSPTGCANRRTSLTRRSSTVPRNCGARGDRRGGKASWRRGSAPAPFWLHLDVDVLDQAIFPATDYLQPDGLDWDELAALLGPLTTPDSLVGASLACYNPDKDPGLECGRRLIAALGT